MRLREHPGILEGRTDALRCKPWELSVIEGYNVRDLTTEEARAELDELKAQIKQHGVKTPLVVRFDGTTIWIIEGHRRHKVVLELIEEFKASDGREGCDIASVPIIAEAPGTKDVDRDFGLETSNSGTKLKPLELAELIYRLKTVRGLTIEDIAKGLGKSVEVTRRTLEMRAMPEPIKEHVRAKEISATLANRIAKGVDPEEAERLIKANLEENRRIKGKDRAKVTSGTLKRDSKPKADKIPVPPPKSAAKVTAPVAQAESDPEQAAAFDNGHKGSSEYGLLADSGTQAVAGSVASTSAMATPIRDLTSEQCAALNAAEEAIQKILIDLEGVVGAIDGVNVDIRNFANLSVEIFVRDARVAA